MLRRGKVEEDVTDRKTRWLVEVIMIVRQFKAIRVRASPTPPKSEYRPTPTTIMTAPKSA